MQNLASICDCRSLLMCSGFKTGINISTCSADEWRSFWLRLFSHPSPNFYKGSKKCRIWPKFRIWGAVVLKQSKFSKTWNHFGSANGWPISASYLCCRSLPNFENLGLQNTPPPKKKWPRECVESPNPHSSSEPKVYQRSSAKLILKPRFSNFVHLLCTVVKKGDFWPRFAKQSTLMLSGFETNQHIWSVKVRCECQSLIYLISELPVQKTGGCKIALWKRGWKNSFDHQ